MTLSDRAPQSVPQGAVRLHIGAAVLLGAALASACGMAQQAVQKGLDRAAENIAEGATGASAPEQADRGCRKDTDCKGERVCVDGACMDVSGTASAGDSTTGSSTARHEGSVEQSKRASNDPGPLPSALPELDF